MFSRKKPRKTNNPFPKSSINEFFVHTIGRALRTITKFHLIVSNAECFFIEHSEGKLKDTKVWVREVNRNESRELKCA